MDVSKSFAGLVRTAARGGVSLVALALMGAAARADDDQAPPPIQDRIIAVVNNEPITRRTIVQRARLMNTYRKAEANPQIPEAVQAMAQIEAKELREIIEERLIIQEAARKDIKMNKDDEEELEDLLKRMAEPAGGIDGYKKALEGIGSSFEVVKAKQRSSIMIGKVYATNVSSKIFIHPKDVREYYEQNQDQFMIEPRTEVRRLMLTLDPEDMTPAIKKWLVKQKREWNIDTCKILAAQLREDLAAGKVNPGLLVKKFDMRYSNRTRAGLRVFVDDNDEDGIAEVTSPVGLPEICAELKEGEASQVSEIRTRSGKLRGYQVVLMELRRKRAAIPFQRAQGRISQIIRRNQFQAMANAWTRDLRSRADIRYFNR